MLKIATNKNVKTTPLHRCPKGELVCINEEFYSVCGEDVQDLATDPEAAEEEDLFYFSIDGMDHGTVLLCNIKSGELFSVDEKLEVVVVEATLTVHNKK